MSKIEKAKIAKLKIELEELKVKLATQPAEPITKIASVEISRDVENSYTIYEATMECYVGTSTMGYVPLLAGQLIGLNEEHERALPTVKYKKEVTDPRTGEKKLVWFQHLRPATSQQVDEAKEVDGMITYPAPTQVRNPKPGVQYTILPSAVPV